MPGHAPRAARTGTGDRGKPAALAARRVRALARPLPWIRRMAFQRRRGNRPRGRPGRVSRGHWPGCTRARRQRPPSRAAPRVMGTPARQGTPDGLTRAQRARGRRRRRAARDRRPGRWRGRGRGPRDRPPGGRPAGARNVRRIRVFRPATTTALGSLPRARPAAIGRTGLRLSRDPFRAILFVITVLTVSRVHQHFPLLAKARPVLVLYMLTAAFIVLAPRSVSMTTLFRTWPPKVVAALGVVACISALFGISFGGAASFLVSVYSSVLVYAFLLFIGIRNARELYTFVWAFLVGVALLVWQALAVFHLLPVPGQSIARLAEMYTYDSNDLGCVLIVGLVLAVLTLLVAGKKGKVTSAMLLVGIGVALARSGSRGAFVGLLGTGCALLLSLKRVSVVKRVGFVAIVGGGLAVAAPPGSGDQIGPVLGPTKDSNWHSGAGRREFWP